jgi:hypothetical protein
MHNYTLKISEQNEKSKALINFLKSLDFVELTKANDWWDELGAESKASIERGIDDLKNDRVHSDQKVRNSIKERILNANKG